MKSFFAKCKTAVVAVRLVLCFIAITDGLASAQGINPRASGALRRNERMQRQNEEYHRDRLERELESGPERSRGRKNEADALQARRDFDRLQTNYNRIVLAMASREDLPRKAILEDVAEIKKAAARLKSKLALPQEVEEPKTARTVELDFSGRLLNLRQHLYDFLTNPLFDNPGAYEVGAARRASIDLKKIIEVSENIGKQMGNK